MTPRSPRLKEKRQRRQPGTVPEGRLSVESLPELLLLSLEGGAPLPEKGHLAGLQGGHVLPHSDGQLFYVVPFLRQLLQRRRQCAQTHLGLPSPQSQSGEVPRVLISAAVPGPRSWCQQIVLNAPCLDLFPGLPALLTVTYFPLNTVLLVPLDLTSSLVVRALFSTFRSARLFSMSPFLLTTSSSFLDLLLFLFFSLNQKVGFSLILVKTTTQNTYLNQFSHTTPASYCFIFIEFQVCARHYTYMTLRVQNMDLGLSASPGFHFLKSTSPHSEILKLSLYFCY